MLSPHAPLVFTWTRTQLAAVSIGVLACAFAPGIRPRAVEPRDASADPRPPGSWLLYAETIDASTVSQEDFETLSGIGPAKAAAIVAVREARGGFCDVEEVRRAAGVGGERWERIAPLIRLSRPRCSSSSRE